MSKLLQAQSASMPLSQWLQHKDDGDLQLSDRQRRNLERLVDQHAERLTARIDAQVSADHAACVSEQQELRAYLRDVETNAKTLADDLVAGLVDPEAGEAELKGLYRAVRKAREELEGLRARETRANEFGATTASEYEAQLAQRFPALFADGRGYLSISEEELNR